MVSRSCPTRGQDNACLSRNLLLEGKSIKSLLKRACRFLGHAQQEDKTMPASVGICCWKVSLSRAC